MLGRFAAMGNTRRRKSKSLVALAVGVREATIFYHAGVIAAKLHDNASAARYLNQSVELNPSSESAAAAREALQKLAPDSAISSRREVSMRLG